MGSETRGWRSYNDPCGIARGLDAVGERWALLVVRELLFGPKRFTELRRGLHGASQNVLSQRLRELERAEIVRRRKLGPPAATWAYELTDRGRELEPVLFQLARWGSRSTNKATSELSTDALMFALKTAFDPRAAGNGLRASYELRLDGDQFRATVSDGTLELTRGRAEKPDAVIESTAAILRRVVFGDRRLADARGAGELRIEGDDEAAQAFTGLFPRPKPDHGPAE